MLDEQRKVNTRNKFLALLGSVFVPGMGQVYNGEVSKGFILFFSFLSIPLFFSWLALQVPVAMLSMTMIFGILLASAIYLFAVGEAYWRARKIKEQQSFVRTPLNKVYLYVLFIFVGQFAIGHVKDTIRTKYLESFTIPSESMRPTLIPGDVFFVDKRVNYPGAAHTLTRDDMAVFVSPNERNKIFIKRVVGLPGDKIKLQGLEVLVNGQEIPWDKHERMESTELTKQLLDREIIVPNGEVFVLGDNRLNSYDSRFFGTVPLRDIAGIPRQIWFSRSAEKGLMGINWERIGHVLNGK